ncbi:hypothetical protein ACFC9N_10730 [Enterococcus casseliflavus]|uniref:hypothetical protein n=1 Tax=Enterococcus TaxID=1350 RepID=UPI000A3A7F94|nr:hypothetical protein [Enterococcus sp. 4E1_DIV0656]OTO09143.1 hypothetical protein A5882_003473 [Enterococcus sp. 4E1_DIV0656]
MAKIAFISNREDPNSYFTRKEDFNWKAIKHAVWEELSKPEWRGQTFLIPIYSRFDRFVLYCAERLQNEVIFYIPQQEWGEHAIPQNQIDLVKRMKARYPKVVERGNQQRLERMLDDCDAAFALMTGSSLDCDTSMMRNKKMKLFDFESAVASYTYQQEMKQQPITTRR